MPAPVQITAEQLLREAKERELELAQPVSITVILYKLTGHVTDTGPQAPVGHFIFRPVNF